MERSFGEFDLIAQLRSAARPDGRVPLGIGDDAAIVSASGDGEWLVAADMLLEGRHFEVTAATPRLIGRKALAVNLSDIAAMAGRPVAAFVTVAHRRDYGADFARELHAGLQELAEEFEVAIAGGDTNVWDGPVVVSVTLLGEVARGRAVTRRGAQPRDRIFVTGRLGGSLASGRHLSFTPRVREALRLHEHYDLHAMIDVSDGLLADLGHICDESGVGAELNDDAIPLHPSLFAEPRGVPRAGEQTERTSLERALTDGEDFELVFCVSEADAKRLEASRPQGEAPYLVGRIVEGSGVTVLDADGSPLEFNSSGWVHRW
jgi:thiamine-monophosphate kinase